MEQVVYFSELQELAPEREKEIFDALLRLGKEKSLRGKKNYLGGAGAARARACRLHPLHAAVLPAVLRRKPDAVPSEV